MAALNRGYLRDHAHRDCRLLRGRRFLLITTCGSSPAGVIGMVTSYVFVWITQYYTEYRYRPVHRSPRPRSPARPPTSSPALPLAWSRLAPGRRHLRRDPRLVPCGVRALPELAGAGLFGTAIATMGMLATAAYILAMDTFGPITDNAGGIIEMSGAPEEVRTAHRPSRLRGQHHQGPHQGIRHRLRSARRLPPVLGLHRRDQ